MKFVFATLSLLLLIPISSFAGERDLLGYWEGAIERDGEQLEVQFKFTESNGEIFGTIGFPDRGRLDIPITNITVKKNKVSILIRPGGYKFILNGTLKKGVFFGSWEWAQHGFSTPFRVSRTDYVRSFKEEEVTFKNEQDGVELAGTVLSPKSNGPHPGIVLIHGSGDNERWWVRNIAELFAKNGFTTLLFDKRGCGKSGGEWEIVTLETLAMDGVAGIHLLQSRSDVAPKKVGFWGISQAGWIMPIGATNSPDVTFITTTSGPAVTIEEEGYFDYIVKLRDLGYPKSVQDEARAFVEKDFWVSVTGEGYEELKKEAAIARMKPWFSELDYFVYPVNSNSRRFEKYNGLFDPIPVLKKVDIPVLFLFGAADKSVEPSTNIPILEKLIREDDKNFTTKVFANADHSIRVPVDSVFPYNRPAEGYHQYMVDWIREVIQNK